jgi:hypothetical protein
MLQALDEPGIDWKLPGLHSPVLQALDEPSIDWKLPGHEQSFGVSLANLGNYLIPQPDDQDFGDACHTLETTVYLVFKAQRPRLCVILSLAWKPYLVSTAW